MLLARGDGRDRELSFGALERAPVDTGRRAVRAKDLAARADVGIARASSAKRSRSDRSAAKSAACESAPSSRDLRSMWARRGCTPSDAISRPCGVMRPSASSAPSRASRSRALASIAAGGGSSHRRSFASRTPQFARSSASGVRSASVISGGENGARLRCADSPTRDNHAGFHATGPSLSLVGRGSGDALSFEDDSSPSRDRTPSAARAPNRQRCAHPES